MARQTKFNCPSGNCTWDSFPSLTICSACNDLTHQLTKVNSPISGAFCQTAMESILYNYTMYRLPNGLGLRNRDDDQPDDLMIGLETGYQSKSISFGSTDTLI